MQAACPDDLHPDLNNVDDLKTNLANAKVLTAQLATTPTTSATSNALAARVSALVPTATCRPVQICVALCVAHRVSIRLCHVPDTSLVLFLRCPQTFAASLSAMQGLTTRSVMNIYTFLPDYTCSMLYRYQWFNTFLTLFGLVLVALAVAFNVVHNVSLSHHFYFPRNIQKYVFFYTCYHTCSLALSLSLRC